MIKSMTQSDTLFDLAARYRAVTAEIEAVVEGEPNLVARMATVAALLAQTFEQFLWTGFYLVDQHRADQLVVGSNLAGVCAA
jgi:GAF domain-containing protein